MKHSETIKKTALVACTNWGNMISLLQEDPVVQRLRKIGMDPKDKPHHTGKRRASILVPLFRIESGEWRMLLTKRPMNLRTHAGEVCFPGGKQDEQDGLNDIRTALREANEEVGLDEQYITPICRLETIESAHGLCVTPVVAVVHPHTVVAPESLTLSSAEVEAAFSVPLNYFVADDNHASKEEVFWSGETFIMRVFMYEETAQRSFRIWGLTAHVAHLVAELALDLRNT